MRVSILDSCRILTAVASCGLLNAIKSGILWPDSDGWKQPPEFFFRATSTRNAPADRSPAVLIPTNVAGRESGTGSVLHRTLNPQPTEFFCLTL